MKVGIALGAGSARGWAHIGVLRALAAAGIKPDIFAGASIGALVGAVYANGGLADLEKWGSELTWRGVVSFFDISLDGGFIKGAKLVRFLEDNLLDRKIEDLPIEYSAVATNFENGYEVWLRKGNVAQAARASFALPGLFTPVELDGCLPVDGGTGQSSASVAGSRDGRGFHHRG